MTCEQMYQTMLNILTIKYESEVAQIRKGNDLEQIRTYLQRASDTNITRNMFIQQKDELIKICKEKVFLGERVPLVER
jgi:hypothetical protein